MVAYFSASVVEWLPTLVLLIVWKFKHLVLLSGLIRITVQQDEVSVSNAVLLPALAPVKCCMIVACKDKWYC